MNTDLHRAFDVDGDETFLTEVRPTLAPDIACLLALLDADGVEFTVEEVTRHDGSRILALEASHGGLQLPACLDRAGARQLRAVLDAWLARTS